MTGRLRNFVALSLVLVLVATVKGGPAWALGEAPRAGRETLTQYLTPELVQAIFPGADKTGEVGGTPPSAPVTKHGQLLGYLFSTWDVTQSRGFSNRPIVLLVGISLDGKVTGARLVHHSEPISILGIRDEEFFRFAESFTGFDVKRGVDVVKQLTNSPLDQGTLQRPGQLGAAKVDAVSRATTTSVLMSDAIVRGGRIVARSRGLLDADAGPATRLDTERFAPADWLALEANGAIGHLRLSYGELYAQLPVRVVNHLPGADPADQANPFLDLYAALLTPAGIGINVLGKFWYDQYTAGRGIDDQLLLIATNARYPVLGSDPERTEVLRSLELVQGENTVPITGKQIKMLPFLHGQHPPALTERALVFFRDPRQFDPTKPWRLRLLISAPSDSGQPEFASFDLHYKLPDEYLTRETGAGATSAGVAGDERGLAWQSLWWAHPIKLGVLGAALALLAVILFLQDPISRKPRLHQFIRIGFLSWTLVWLGWYAGGQLTIVYLLTWIHTAVTDFRWDYVLADPLVTTLALFTGAGLFLWGRAVFCGWLCPFGALQELSNKAARRLGLPQFHVPEALHERLLSLKYLVVLGLVAVSFVSWDLAMQGTEIEPFKTAIVLRFMTSWPLVTYAGVLIVAGLFVERFYCRFACPLGAGLAILGRVRMFNWLKRRPECGSRCRLCESVCPVGAIKRSGAIDMNECFYCLDCQVTYYDAHTCPPLVLRRKRGGPAPARPVAAGPAFGPEHL